MKVYVQIVDCRTGIYQCGMIDEPVMEGKEIENALAHFGINCSGCSTECWSENAGIMSVDRTTKIVSIVKIP